MLSLAPFLFFVAVIPQADALPSEHLVPQTPALSPDGTQVAYSHQGDLWVAPVASGLATRLTAHPSYDGHPHWSPDGSRIAFTSHRHGNVDIFVVAASGGTVQRLTWHVESETLHGWVDEETVLMGATRDRWYSRYGRDQGVWSLSIHGGDPQLIGDFAAQRVCASADGRYLIYERGSGDVRRRAYRGSAASNLWVYDQELQEHRRLTKRDGNDMMPKISADGQRVFFLSDAPCAGNEQGREMTLWAISFAGGEAKPISLESGSSYRSLSLSASGNAMVSVGQRMDLIHLPSELVQFVSVHGAMDGGRPRFQNVTRTKGAEQLAVSPDGEMLAFSAKGDIYVMRNHEDIHRAVRVTTHPAPDANPVWGKDGKSLWFESERDGNGELYSVAPEQEDEPFYQSRAFSLRRLTETSADESGFLLAPDGDKAVWLQGNGTLVLGDPETLVVSRVLHVGFDAPRVEWSPDSAWLVWSVANDDFNEDIWLARAEIEGLDAHVPGVKPWNLSSHPDDDTAPHWSPDGRKIVFTSRRRMLDETDVWVAWLRREDVERTERERLEAKEAEEKENEEEKETKEGADEKGEEKKDEEVVDPIQIDFDGLSQRIHRLTRREGNESALGWGEDSETIYFNASTGTRLTTSTTAETGFFSTDIWEKEEEKLSDKTASSFTLHDKEAWYVRDGKIRSRGKKEKAHTFSVHFREDRLAMRQTVLEQGWRVLDRWFYDPSFHGHDWAGSLEKWSPVLMAASTPEDFNQLMNWMLGEMNASHMGYYRGASSAAKEMDSTKTGELGVLWDHAYDGPGRRIANVLPQSPASRLDSPLRAGDVVLGVNQVMIQGAVGLDELLAGTVERETMLHVADASGEGRDVLIRPDSTSFLREALYEKRERDLRARTSAATDGKIGYIHIQGMSTPSLLEFERELYAAAEGRKALIVDVRENGGGWTTDMLLSMLQVNDHAFTIPRGGGTGYPQGRRVFGTWSQPVIVLCNQNSYSNAEIFSWAIKTLKRGTLVGMPTHGAVISTGGTTLLDGSFVRMPFRGWYVNDESHTNMELNGCPPDYWVEDLPGDFAKGLDRQLEKALQVGLELVQ